MIFTISKIFILYNGYRIFFIYGVSAEKRNQIDKNFFFKITNILDQMIRFTSILLINFFLKKNSIWSFFSALTPYVVFFYFLFKKFLRYFLIKSFFICFKKHLKYFLIEIVFCLKSF